MFRATSLWVGLVLLFGVPALAGTADGLSERPNILLILADDMGVDLMGAYGEHPDADFTPVLDALAQRGLLFRNVWSNAACSPSRATILTGRYSHRTGIGQGVEYYATPFELSVDEQTLPRVLGAEYRTAAVGKWHLGARLVSGPRHPNTMGFETFSGSMTILDGFIGDAYYEWPKVVDTTPSVSTTYHTTETVDDAIELIDSYGREPWFLWLAFHAPHAPYHKPPAHLHDFDLPDPIIDHIPVHVRAAAQVMDTEIGRLFDSMGPSVLARTVVIFAGDNGTSSRATTAPFDPEHAKLTVFEGGINVPLVIAGPGVVEGKTCQALVNTTDLFATVAELGGSAARAEDSVSLVPYLSDPDQPGLRSWVYAEHFLPNGHGPPTYRLRTVRDLRYKLIYEYVDLAVPTSRLFFDVENDPFETTNLLGGPLATHAQSALTKLSTLLAEDVPLWQSAGPGTPGTDSVVPVLTGEGSLQPGEPFTITLTSAYPDTPAFAVGGLANVSLSLHGGTLFPRADGMFLVQTGVDGSIEAGSTWPPGVPSGTTVLFQYWIADPMGMEGVAASNGLVAIAP
jgi:arylsulfatase A-like enzyme